MKPATLAKHMKRLNVRKLEIAVIDGPGLKLTVHAKAIPQSWHPKVAERREAAHGRLERDISLSEASKITEDSMAALAAFSAPTIEEAVEGLLKLL
jgi:hypothetical protein